MEVWRPEEGQSERTEGIPERLRKQESRGGAGGWLGGRGGGVSRGWGWGGGETTEVRLSSGQSPEQGARGPDKAGSGGASCGGDRVTWALQREQSGQHWDTPQRQETSQEALRIGSGGGPSPGPDAAPQRTSELEGPYQSLSSHPTLQMRSQDPVKAVREGRPPEGCS